MDKLEPILKHHFWILLVPLLSMNLWGYFSANGALKAATSTRQTTLDGVKSKVPAGTNDPNEQYAAELGKQNEDLEKFVQEELQQLWARQQARMTWPQAVAADIPKGYRSDIADNLVRFAYQNVYYQDVIKPLHDSVEPMTMSKDLTYVPKVDFPIHLIPQMKVGNFTITSTQMWDAQEDVWVTQLILDAIRQMNKDADSTSSAVIRRVISYRLLGGDGTPVAGGGAAGGAMGSSSGGEDSPMMMMPTGEGYGGGGGAGAGAKVQTSVRFSPSEEFGVGGEAAAGGGTGAASSMMMMPSEGSDGGTTATATEVLRYVKFDPASTVETAPFMERGFYLSVIINQNKLVDFLVALSNSEWPIKVVRFHIGKNPWKTDEFKASGTLGGGAMAMGNGPMGSMMMAPGMQGGSDPVASPFGLGGGSGAEAMGSGLPGGFGGGAGANTGYKVTDLDHPDLIQLDLAGLVTIYRDPNAAAATGDAAAEGAPTDGTAPAEGEKPADAAPPTAGDAAPVADGSAPAPAEGAPAGEAAPAATEPAATPAPNEEAPATETPAATPAPTDGVTPAPTDAAAPAPQETPAAAEPAAPAAPDTPANP